MIPLRPGWKETIRKATSDDGPVLAFHQKHDSWETGDLFYLKRFWYLTIYPLVLYFNRIHERTHPLIEEHEDCPDECCIMYGMQDGDSWKEKNPFIWVKILWHRITTGDWFCKIHRKKINDAITRLQLTNK